MNIKAIHRVPSYYEPSRRKPIYEFQSLLFLIRKIQFYKKVPPLIVYNTPMKKKRDKKLSVIRIRKQQRNI
jgi:hypothetical protein